MNGLIRLTTVFQKGIFLSFRCFNSIYRGNSAHLMNFILIAFLIIYAIWKFSPGYEREKSFAVDGDAYGTMIYIHELHEEVLKHGLLDVFIDPSIIDINKSSFGIGGPAAPQSRLWILIYGIGSSFLSPDNTYDTIVLLSFLFIGTAWIILGSSLGWHPLILLFSSIIVMNLNIFYFRMVCALTLLSYYISILQIWAAFKAGKSPTLRNMVIYAVICFLCFVFNEYLGYHGFIFSATLLLSLYIFYGVWQKRDLSIPLNRQQAVVHGTQRNRYVPPSHALLNSAVATTVFLILMLFEFWPVFSALFGGVGGADASVANSSVARPWSDFVLLTVHNPIIIFEPKLMFLRDWFADDIFSALMPPYHSAHFKIGMIIPATILAALIGLFFVKALNYETRTRRILSYSSALIFATCVVAAFGLSPDFKCSLVRLTYYLAPMFRHGGRSFLFVDFGLILLFFFLLDLVFRSLFKKWHNASFLHRCTIVFCTAFLLSICSLATIDAVGSSPFLKTPPNLLTDFSTSSRLPKNGKGLVAELPFFESIPETDWHQEYRLHALAHGRPVLNIWAWGTALYYKMLNFGKEINALDIKSFERLRKLGVRFIVAHRSRGVDTNKIEKSGQVTKLFENGDQVAYEVKNWLQTPQIVLKDYLERFSYYVPASALSTKIGMRSDGSLVTNGKGGLLVFGPYISLPAGQYVVKWIGEMENPPDVRLIGRVDVTTDVCKNYLGVKDVIYGVEEPPLLARMEIVLEEDASDVEFHFYVIDGRFVTLKGISFEPAKKENK